MYTFVSVLFLIIHNVHALKKSLHESKRGLTDCSPKILYFRVWDATNMAPFGDAIINESNQDVCFPSSNANIEAVIEGECQPKNVTLILTQPDGNVYDHIERQEPFLVFGDKIFEDPPKVNGRSFIEGGVYRIMAYANDDATNNALTLDFRAKLCEDDQTLTPTASPTIKPLNDCKPKISHFRVWDVDAIAPYEIISESDQVVCFPSTGANIEAVMDDDCKPKQVTLNLTLPDGSFVNHVERREPFMVFGDRIFEDPPKINGQLFVEGAVYSIMAYANDENPADALTLDFQIEFCEDDHDLSPTESPTNKPTSLECRPTQGKCGATRDELQEQLDTASPGDTVAICGGATIDTSNAAHILLEQENLTLCCEASGCLLSNNGSDRNLVVTGNDATLAGIEFVGGVAPKDSTQAGGNVFWKSSGDCHIRDCIFRDGFSPNVGGNLYASSNGWENYNITIERSKFSGGFATYGGGAFITDAEVVVVRDCDFTANIAQYEFRGAENGIGGGLFISSEFGQMPKLEIWNSSFDDNEQGAVGVFAYYDTIFSGNQGTGNTMHGIHRVVCTGFYGFDFGCLPLDVDYP